MVMTLAEGQTAARGVANYLRAYHLERLQRRLSAVIDVLTAARARPRDTGQPEESRAVEDNRE